MPMYKNSKRKI